MGPVRVARIVMKMASNYAADNITKLKAEECEALELFARTIMRLERLFKQRAI